MNPSPFRYQLELSPLYPLFLLDRFLGHRARHRLLWLLSWLLVGLWLVLFLVWLAPLWPSLERFLLGLAPYLKSLTGLAFIFFSLWLKVYLLEAFFRHQYFVSPGSPEASFEVGRFLFRAKTPDLVAAFLVSDLGSDWLARLGVPAAERDKFLAARSTKTSAAALTLQNFAGLPFLVEGLFDGNQDLATWLLGFEIGRREAAGAARWVERTRHERRAAERWWTRERLGRIPGLAKDWAYGRSYLLDRYSLDLSTLAETRPLDPLILSHREAVEQVETILVRAREANALLVGPAGAPLEVVYELTALVRSGRVFPALEGKQPKLLRVAALLSRFRGRTELEAEISQVFDEAVRAGNILLVIDDLPSLILQAGDLAANLEHLLDPYLASDKLQVVALAETGSYHRVLESSALLRERFETVLVDQPSPEVGITRLIEAAEKLEERYGGRPPARLVFTYPALDALADVGEQFAGARSALNQSLDLLFELAPWALSRGIFLVGQKEVLRFAADKLGVPLGAAGPEERSKLLNLEASLSQRVIGQDQALCAIANALRRSRAGIRNLKRPLGSFLFLGPTGVGKTETAKALAAVFFGGEDRLLRLDMSEYRGAEALSRLIGSAATGEPGGLAKLLRDEPYGVLLLDEFEKTEPAVLDLFLQILDEGFFSDSRGERVNARNILFIATSNAGAPLIWELVGAGQHLIESEKTIIDSLIKRGIFKPELLNRFDGVILFNPLDEAAAKAVARLLLEKLAVRLKERGLIFQINDDLVGAVTVQGADKQFGARPLARFIQDRIEQVVAGKILAGEIKSGQTFTVLPPEFSLKIL